VYNEKDVRQKSPVSAGENLEMAHQLLSRLEKILQQSVGGTKGSVYPEIQPAIEEEGRVSYPLRREMAAKI